MMKFIDPSLNSNELKRNDRSIKKIKFNHIDPVVLSIWKYRLSSLHLDTGEVSAFVKGIHFTAPGSYKHIDIKNHVFIALYQYYRQSDNIINSARKAEITENKIFNYLGWLLYDDDENLEGV
ncbi:MAG: hypothetical protein QXU98_01730 [Candidatus Parvarchaeota archaeon]